MCCPPSRFPALYFTHRKIFRSYPVISVDRFFVLCIFYSSHCTLTVCECLKLPSISEKSLEKSGEKNRCLSIFSLFVV